MDQTQHVKLALTTRMPIRWGDMDAYGHVNNTIYFRYMEQARCEWLEQLGYAVRPEGEAPVIINASCTFLQSLMYPGEVEVRMFIGQPGRSSLMTTYELRQVGQEAIYATGASKIVWMNMETGKSAPLPEALRALVEDGGADS